MHQALFSSQITGSFKTFNRSLKKKLQIFEQKGLFSEVLKHKNKHVRV